MHPLRGNLTILSLEMQNVISASYRAPFLGIIRTSVVNELSHCLFRQWLNWTIQPNVATRIQ